MDLSMFLKKNKKNTETVKYIASKSFVDEKGQPIPWEIRALKSKEADEIRNECYKFDKKGKTKVDTAKFNRMVATRCTVFPNLNDKALQDSYGVMGAEQLIQEMLDKDGEYQAYTQKILEISGYDEDMNDLVEEAKN